MLIREVLGHLLGDAADGHHLALLRRELLVSLDVKTGGESAANKANANWRHSACSSSEHVSTADDLRRRGIEAYFS
jgi:hypothetical protein